MRFSTSRCNHIATLLWVHGVRRAQNAVRFGYRFPGGKDAPMSLRRSCCSALVLTASLSALLGACAQSGGEAPGVALSEPALAAKPSTAGAASETQSAAKAAARAELAKTAAARPEPPKTAARPEPAKTAARAEPPKTAARQEPAKTAARTEPRQATPAAETSACDDGGDCMAQLKRMVDGTNRTWVGRAEPPQQFADGTRLFAYRALRPKLNCRELSLALTEIDASSKRLQDPASSISPDRAERVATLAADVAGELKTERAGRCSSTSSTSARTKAAGVEPARSQ